MDWTALAQLPPFCSGLSRRVFQSLQGPPCQADADIHFLGPPALSACAVCTRTDPLSCPSLCTPRLIGTRCPSTLPLSAFSQGFPRSPFASQAGRRFVFMSHKSNLPVSHLSCLHLALSSPSPPSLTCLLIPGPVTPRTHSISPSTSATVLAEPAISKKGRLLPRPCTCLEALGLSTFFGSNGT